MAIADFIAARATPPTDPSQPEEKAEVGQTDVGVMLQNLGAALDQASPEIKKLITGTLSDVKVFADQLTAMRECLERIEKLLAKPDVDATAE